MKKIISIIMAVLPALLFAQSADRQVMGSTGGSGSGTGIQVSYTIGEVVIATDSSATITLAQGFQQPNSRTVGIEDISGGLSVKVFPNPFKSIVTLEIAATHNMELIISVFDVNGKQTALPVHKLSVNGKLTHKVDFSLLCAGNYFLRLESAKGDLKKTIKVQKVD